MALREIVQANHPSLRKKAIRVNDFDKKFQTLVDDMVETMTEAPGVGLAAPQVAVNQRLIVVRLTDDEKSQEEYGDQAGKLYVVANPEIIKSSKEMAEGVEGCLSIPGYLGLVDRHETVVITGQDRHGKALRVKAEGWLARVFQHEIDHLEGRLYIDLAKKVWEQEADEETAE
jgi:peptide deformylase